MAWGRQTLPRLGHLVSGMRGEAGDPSWEVGTGEGEPLEPSGSQAGAVFRCRGTAFEGPHLIWGSWWSRWSWAQEAAALGLEVTLEVSPRPALNFSHEPPETALGRAGPDTAGLEGDGSGDGVPRTAQHSCPSRAVQLCLLSVSTGVLLPLRPLPLFRTGWLPWASLLRLA